MKVLLKRVNEKSSVIDIDNSIETYHNLVGGFIEIVHLTPWLVVVCDDEGILKNKLYNISITSNGNVFDFYGDIFVCSTKMTPDGEDFADIPEGWENLFE